MLPYEYPIKKNIYMVVGEIVDMKNKNVKNLETLLQLYVEKFMYSS